MRRLELDDDRSSFRSGHAELDRFFHLYAGQNQFRHHLGTTYIAVDGQAHIGGFATVAPGELAPATDLPDRKRRPRYPLPVLRLARLAVDERLRGAGVGRLLLNAVFGLARDLKEQVGCVGIVVDAKPEAVAFYERLGFFRLQVEAGELGDRPLPIPLFLPIDHLG